MSVIMVALSICSCGGTIKCGWCNEEINKLGAKKAAALGQEIYVCSDCYKALSGK